MIHMNVRRAGKTTTMRTILGLSQPDAGAVRWRRAPVGPDERLRFGYMPEERGLYPKMKVREHIWRAFTG